MKCNQPCVRVTCPRAHPCPLLCSDNCGDCHFPVYDVKLPCGHAKKSVPWQVLPKSDPKFAPDPRSSYMLEDLSAINCVANVSKRLPGCEHSAVMACSLDPAAFTCKEVCGGLTQCCSRTCTSQCHVCQKVTKEKAAAGSQRSQRLDRTHHGDHACQRLLKCQHFCGLPCSSNHSCNPKCPEACRQRCGHRKCEKPCWEPCPPCMEPCEWRCLHQSCPVVCGSVSSGKDSRPP
jgi:hypothetical protein